MPPVVLRSFLRVTVNTLFVLFQVESGSENDDADMLGFYRSLYVLSSIGLTGMDDRSDGE